MVSRFPSRLSSRFIFEPGFDPKASEPCNFRIYDPPRGEQCFRPETTRPSSSKGARIAPSLTEYLVLLNAFENLLLNRTKHSGLHSTIQRDFIV